MRENQSCECDGETLREMLNFVRKDNGCTEAMNGSHDDLVMALAIAHFCAKQQSCDYIAMERNEDSFIDGNFNLSQNGVSYINW